ncbi:MAG: ATP-binding protein [Fluviicoccus sp.]|uniref:ATP-binding protein n=1 Tax=Fluviicoccus sp. TaxID=2003552 RepID=UPI00271D6A34|nr:ATP-binding protein [Fluviicoccus sp.]MDO8329836.1 ATP-binding protein [Fluviicoccus sp.]
MTTTATGSSKTELHSTMAAEYERLHALHALQILDTPPEERFDRLTRIVREVFGIPIVMITLVDADRLWTKSCFGMEPCEEARSREDTFCHYAIKGEDILLVPDARLDTRFAHFKAVTGAPHVRFYAGAPLHAGATRQRVGTLCLMDCEPRTLSSRQLELLRDIADAVEQQLSMQQTVDAVRELNEQRILLYAIFESVADAIFTLDTHGLIENFNPAALRLFDYAADELAGKPVRELVPALEPHLTDGSGGALDSNLEGRRKNGVVFPLEAGISPMQMADRTMFTVVMRDISERRHMERLKNEFISTVSHELRTPLTSIRGALGLVLGKASDGLSPKAKQLLETATRNSERLTLLINDILDLEKIESGRLEFIFTALDLVAVTRQAISANESYASQHQVSLRLDGAPEQALISGDEHRLLQVFANLISNAVKYSPPGGVVTICIDRQYHYWRVSVHDNGKGIPDAFRPRIFQRFAQADASDTRDKGGTGLGLSITKAIVERHEGAVDYTSAPGDTEFFFTLPATEIGNPAGEAVEARFRLLICENNSDTALMLSELLQEEGFACDIAFSIAKVKALLMMHTYDAMLLDIAMTEGDSMTLLQDLREHPEHRKLPVIMINGHQGDPTSGPGFDVLNISDWLHKPVDPERLKQALRQVLQAGGKPRILHVEDAEDILQITQLLVEDIADYTPAASLAEARQALKNGFFDLVLLDLGLPDGNGLSLLEQIDPRSQVLVFSGKESSSAISNRVAESLTKSKTSNEELLATIRKLIHA